ncbi:MAG: methionine biosynthesis protein MetW [Bryobacterales bacterium]|nr:methionine biosynthesis protein MetW [Bryobacterales bacterium]
MKGEHGPLVHELFGRGDYGLISEIVEPGSCVLDLGCGEGELLAWLAEHKDVDARGVEISPVKLQKAIAKGVSAYQGDIETCLADYPDKAFDYVLLSQTLQEIRYPLQVMTDILRVSRRAIVAFPNFGHYSVRLAHLFNGRAPKTKLFPYDWYDSPNIHFLTVDDFEILAARQNWQVERRYFLSGTREVKSLPNLMAEVAVFVVSKR